MLELMTFFFWWHFDLIGLEWKLEFLKLQAQMRTWKGQENVFWGLK